MKNSRRFVIIGIDARFYGPGAKGLGRYAQKLIEELEKIDDQNDYLIFLRREDFGAYQPHNLRFKKVLADWRWYSLGEQLFFPWQLYRHKIGLMHFAHFNAPILYRRPYIVTIHDLILRQWPTMKNDLCNRVKYFFKNLGYKFVIHSILARAKIIITVSQWVKKDIIKSFGTAEEKISVIYEGAPETGVIASPAQAGRSNPVGGGNSSGSPRRFAPRDDKPVLEKYGIKKPYLLYVGNAYPHKNLARLMEAFKILIESGHCDWQMVLAGEEDYFYCRLRKVYNSVILCSMTELSKRQEQKVVFTGFVPDDDLKVLYANAALYVFPSLCEGFGLPPLEAMAQGVPVAASRATCLPEILGSAAHYFDGENPMDMAQKISEILSDETLRQKLIATGFEQIKKYSWRKMAEETRENYSRI